jgi:hypothetical protein
MSPTFDTAVEPFVDRRNYSVPGTSSQREAPQREAPLRERRQFANSYEELTPEARELAQAIDSYKLMHRRRFITYEEMLSVVKSLGYRRD